LRYFFSKTPQGLDLAGANELLTFVYFISFFSFCWVVIGCGKSSNSTSEEIEDIEEIEEMAEI